MHVGMDERSRRPRGRPGVVAAAVVPVRTALGASATDSYLPQSGPREGPPRPAGGGTMRDEEILAAFRQACWGAQPMPAEELFVQVELRLHGPRSKRPDHARLEALLETAIERLRVLGADKDHPTAFVDIVAPASGVITDQQVTAASGTQGLGSPNAFTISDLSRVWVLCDVYENNLGLVNVGDVADIRLNAYPGIVLKGRISNIGSILDPNIRTAKVRIDTPVELDYYRNGGILQTVLRKLLKGG